VVGEPPEVAPKDWKKVMTKDGVDKVLDLVAERLAVAAWEPEALAEAGRGVGEVEGESWPNLNRGPRTSMAPVVTWWTATEWAVIWWTVIE